MKLAFVLGTLVTGLALALAAPAPSATASASDATASAQSAAASGSSDETLVCPPTVYECCDGTSGSGTTACTGHGGKCGILYICGRPY